MGRRRTVCGVSADAEQVQLLRSIDKKLTLIAKRADAIQLLLVLLLILPVLGALVVLVLAGGG